MNWDRISIRAEYARNTPYIAPYRASYGVSFVNIIDDIDRVITAAHCMHIGFNFSKPRWYKWIDPSSLKTKDDLACIANTITLAVQWSRWRLKSPVSRLFAQPFVQAEIKENIKAPRHWSLWGNSRVIGEFPAQSASNAEMLPFDDVIIPRERPMLKYLEISCFWHQTG